MSSIYKRGRAQLQANLTPMIDVTFLLIVFFVLVSQIVEVENVDLNPPELPEPASVRPGEEQRAVINVKPGIGGKAAEYRLGARSYPVTKAGVELLTEQLTSLFEQSPSLRINLRADQRTHYQFVQPVLHAVTTAAMRVDKMNITPRVNLVVVRSNE